MINGNFQYQPTIVCRYSCDGCGLKDHEFTLVARSEFEPLGHFMIRLGDALSLDHAEASPRCNARSCQNLFVPMGKGGAVGAPLAN